jgi:hypothetical protein
MLKKILLTLAAIVVIFLIVVALQPADYRVARSTTMAAPATIVFAQVNDLHRWDAWSPWAKLDPAMKATFDGPAAGKGAIYHWVGNKDVGEGQMTIIESQPSDAIKIQLDFIKPFPSSSITDFSFKPEGSQTAVTWTMSGKNNFVAKAFCLFMNMDKMVGGDFEKGLAQLKTVTEAQGKK